uniref:Crossover junction endonuclease MUS81 n=1 Tax=Heligmosomoides polygyrus TaxID=6339 RepID=A0A8L8K2I9_HELPZ
LIFVVFKASEGRKRKRPAKKVLTAFINLSLGYKRKAIEREISASLNSRCEQYMYCHVSRSVFDEFLATRMVFADRDIQDQLVCEENSSDMVLWYRKCIEVLEEFKVSDCGNESIICCYILFFLQALQHVFAAVLSLNSLKELIRSGRLEDFVATRKLSYSVPSSTLVLIIFGNNSRQVGLACPFFCSVAIYYVVLQGIRDSTPDVLVHDWWDKMLAAICRMQDGQRRAVLSVYPNPFRAYKRFKEIGYTRAVQELADLQAESGRRLGPAMAHRLFMILTDSTGMEIVG